MKRLNKNPQLFGRYEVGSIRAKSLMKSMKRNKRVMVKSEPLYIKNFVSRKSQYPLNKYIVVCEHFPQLLAYHKTLATLITSD